MIETKLIFNSFLAKQLVLAGHKIIDIQKDYKREGGIIFVFKIDNQFIKDLKRFTNN